MSHMSNIKRETRVTIPLAGQTFISEDGTVSEVMEDSINEDYEPSQKEIEDFAKYMGMTLPEDSPFLWIAKEGLKTTLPKEWKPCRTNKNEIYYFNFKTGESTWEHPMDDVFRTKFEQEKARYGQERFANRVSAVKSNTLANVAAADDKQEMTNSLEYEEEEEEEEEGEEEEKEEEDVINTYLPNGHKNNNNITTRNTKNSRRQAMCSSPPECHLSREEISNISASPNVSSVNADSPFSFGKTNKRILDRTFTSDISITQQHDSSNNTSMSLLTEGQINGAHSDVLGAANILAQHNELSHYSPIISSNNIHHHSNSNNSSINTTIITTNNNNNNIAKTNVYMSPTSTLAQRESPFHSTPLASLNNGVSTASAPIMSEAEKALETRIRGESEVAFAAFKQKASEVLHDKLLALENEYDQESAKQKEHHNQQKEELEISLEHATQEQTITIRQQLEAKYKTQVTTLQEQLETLKQNKEHVLKLQQQEECEYRKQSVVITTTSLRNTPIKEEEVKWNHQNDLEAKLKELQRDELKKRMECEMRAEHDGVAMWLNYQSNMHKQKLTETLRIEQDKLRAQAADNFHEREITIATVAEKRRTELNEDIKNIEEEITKINLTLEQLEKNTLQFVNVNNSNASKVNDTQAEAMEVREVIGKITHDEKRKLCEMKQKEIVRLQRELEELEQQQQQQQQQKQEPEEQESVNCMTLTNASSMEKASSKKTILSTVSPSTTTLAVQNTHTDNVNVDSSVMCVADTDRTNSPNTSTNTVIDELRAKHAIELKRVEEMYRTLRAKLQSRLDAELHGITTSNAISGTVSEEAITAKNDVKEVTQTEEEHKEQQQQQQQQHHHEQQEKEQLKEQVIEDALMTDMEVYVNEVQQRRARAKAEFEVQQAKAATLHYLEELKEKQEQEQEQEKNRAELEHAKAERTKTILEKRVSEQLKQERIAAARAHASAMARQEVLFEDKKKSICTAVDEELSTFAEQRRKRWRCNIGEENLNRGNDNSTDCLRKEVIASAETNVNDNIVGSVEEMNSKALHDEITKDKLKKQEHDNNLAELLELLEFKQNDLQRLRTELNNLYELQENENSCKSNLVLKQEQKHHDNNIEKQKETQHATLNEAEELEHITRLVAEYEFTRKRLEEELLSWKNVNTNAREELENNNKEQYEINETLLHDAQSSNWPIKPHVHSSHTTLLPIPMRRNVSNVSTPSDASILLPPYTHKRTTTTTTTTPATKLWSSSLLELVPLHQSQSESSLLSQTPLTSREAQWYCKSQLNHMAHREMRLSELRNQYARNIQELTINNLQKHSSVESSSCERSEELHHVDEELASIIDVLKTRINYLTSDVRELYNVNEANGYNTHYSVMYDKNASKHKPITPESTTEENVKYDEPNQLDKKWQTHLLHLYHC